MVGHTMAFSVVVRPAQPNDGDCYGDGDFDALHVLAAAVV